MRVVVVVAHPDPDSFTHAIASTAAAALSKAGHQTTVVDLYGEGFRVAMSKGEWLAYHGDRPILDPMVERHAEIIKQAEALVFVYPTWWSTMPAILKGWLERVLVPGVGFVFDEKQRVRRGLTQVRRIVGISTIRLAEAVREGNARQRSAHVAARTEAQHGDPHTPIVARACYTTRQLHRCQACRVPAAVERKMRSL